MELYVASRYPRAVDGRAFNETMLIMSAIRNGTFARNVRAIARDLSAIIAPEHIIELMLHGEACDFDIIDRLDTVQVGVLIARTSCMAEILKCSDRHIEFALNHLASHAGAIVAALAEYESRTLHLPPLAAVLTSSACAKLYDARNHCAFIRQIASECAWDSRVALETFASFVRPGDPREKLAQIYGRRAAWIALAMDGLYSRMPRECFGDARAIFESHDIAYGPAQTATCEVLMRELYGCAV